MPAAERRGALWDCYRQLTEAGWSIDCMSYTTAFRCDCQRSGNAFALLVWQRGLQPPDRSVFSLHR